MGRPVPYGTTAHPHGARWAGRRVMRGRGVAPWGRPCRFDGVMLPVTRRDRAGPPAPHASVGRGGLGRWDCGCSLPSRRSRPFRGGPNAYVYGTAFASEERIGPIKGGREGFLLEACAGLLDGESAATRVIRKAQEETRFKVRAPWPTTSRVGRPRGRIVLVRSRDRRRASAVLRFLTISSAPLRVHEVTGLQSTR